MTELEKAITLLQAHFENTDCEDCEVSHLCEIVIDERMMTDEIGVMQ